MSEYALDMPAQADKSPADRNTQFIKDASKGKLKAVRDWINEGMPVIWRGNGNTTALIAASENGHADVVAELIRAGAELNETTTGHWSALALAATRGHFDVVKVLLEAGADPNVETKLGDTALSLAMKNGHRRVAALLEQRGARLSTSKPLHEAACACLKQVALSKQTTSLFGKPPSRNARAAASAQAETLFKEVQRLVRSGAQGGDYALWQAARLAHEPMLDLLLKAKANPNTAPHISSALSDACEEGHLNIVRKLLDGGACVNYGGRGRAPILVAAEHGHTQIVAELIRRGADVNVRARLGPTPLTLAATNGNLELMQLLLDGKADVNLTGTVEIGPRPKPTVEVERLEDSRFFTRTTHSPRAPEALDVPPLVVAVRRGFPQAVRLLLDFGADTEQTDKEGLTAIAWAKKLNDKNIQMLLAQSGANTTADVDGSAENALVLAAASGDVARVRALLSAGANANAHVDSVKERKTPLAEAAKVGHAEIIRMLNAAGAEVDKRVGERLGTVRQTPLMLAAERKHSAAVKALLEAKANVAATDAGVFGGGGETPLHYAARGGNREIAELLIGAGAKISVRTKDGDTPLKIASAEGNKDVIELLLAAGGRIVTRKGRVSEALQNAAFSGNVAAVKMILKANPNAHGSDAEFACLAAHGVKLSVLEALVIGGLPINVKDREGDTPLMYAVRAGRKNVVQFLLSRGADPNARSKEKKSPAVLASDFGHRDTLLLQKAAGSRRR